MIDRPDKKAGVYPRPQMSLFHHVELDQKLESVTVYLVGEKKLELLDKEIN